MTYWGNLYYSLSQVLQSGTTILQMGLVWGRYKKLGQTLLQNGAALGYYKAKEELLQSGATLLQSEITKQGYKVLQIKVTRYYKARLQGITKEGYKVLQSKVITKYGSTLSTLYKTARIFVPSVIFVTMRSPFIVSSKQALFQEESFVKQ